jgi:S1-C subfamily serine protease
VNRPPLCECNDKRRTRVLGIAVVLLVNALLPGGCCSNCAELSRIGAVSFSGPAKTSTDESQWTSRTSPSTSSRASDVPTGGEPVGTGFYVNARGQLLTTWSGIRNCRKVAILDGYRLYNAVVVSANPLNGLAILEAAKYSPAHAIFRDTPPMAGEGVSIATYPVLDGLLLPLETTRNLIHNPTGPESNEGLLQSSALAPSQSAGGPIVDATGAVIGIIARTPKGYGISNAVLLKFLLATGVKTQTRGAGGSESAALPQDMRAEAYTVPVICFR